MGAEDAHEVAHNLHTVCPLLEFVEIKAAEHLDLLPLEMWQQLRALKVFVKVRQEGRTALL